MNKKEMIQLLKTDVEAWNEWRLKNLRATVDLRCSSLQGADLDFATLRAVNLRGADLEHASLNYTVLKGADLRGANLRGANLESANLQDSDLRGANLESANLRGANLRHADLTETIFDNITTFAVELWCSQNLEQLIDGRYVAYKALGETEFDRPCDWLENVGAIWTGEIDLDRRNTCSFGINVAIYERVIFMYPKNPLIKIAFDVVDAVVPYATDGSFRVSKLEVLEWVRVGGYQWVP